jgi:hypothetical protein
MILLELNWIMVSFVQARMRSSYNFSCINTNVFVY